MAFTWFDFSIGYVFCSLQIEDGEIYASINQKDGMVCFHDNPEKYNNPAMLHKIDQEVRERRIDYLSLYGNFNWGAMKWQLFAYHLVLF